MVLDASKTTNAQARLQRAGGSSFVFGKAALVAILVRCFRCKFQLFVDLIEQLFGLLSMSVHVPFVGFLGRGDSFPGRLGKPLRRRRLAPG